MAYYIAEIQGANGSPARVRAGNLDLVACTSGRTGWIPLAVEPGAPGEAPRVALFASREGAREAASAAVWAGQRYRVRAARGRARSTGILVEQ